MLQSHSRIVNLPSHYRPRQSAAVWQRRPPRWAEKLSGIVESASPRHEPVLFFRADDIGAGGKAFENLCRIFRHHRIPLEMAVVPAWLSHTRVENLLSTTPLDDPLWGWHQHGWRHVNWQQTGKKSEFGPQRPYEKQWRDIRKGKRKLTEVLGDRFTPVFTPPWNRLSASTLKVLQELGFRAASTSDPLPRNAKSSPHVRNLKVQVDLHTRKAKDGFDDYDRLLRELEATLEKKDPAGIMIHHQRMTLFAFDFLDELLFLLKNRARFARFAELV